MKYLCLIYIAADELATASPRECLAYAAELADRGHCLAAEALRASEPATTVTRRDGRTAVTDGPFTETKELLAGFYVLEADGVDDVVNLMAAAPPLGVGRAVIRPVWTDE